MPEPQQRTSPERRSTQEQPPRERDSISLGRQSASHPSPLRLFPSSHCSPGSITLFPQIGAVSVWHCSLQPSLFSRLPSSQSSPRSVRPSPHKAFPHDQSKK